MLLLSLVTPGLRAQAPAAPNAIEWWQGAAVLGGVAAASGFDHTLQLWAQRSRSSTTDRVAAIVRHMGQPEVFAAVPLGMIGAGLIADKPALREAGERVTASVAVAGVLVTGLKLVVGRVRPSQTSDPYQFHPFTHSDAFPSGHATMAFALATALGDEIGSPWWVRTGLFAGATATAWSRLNDNIHWLSDVLAGAALGITSAQVMEGKWGAFHIHAPAFSTARTRAGFRWVISVPLP
ncbi:MAG TPA: phosphatase PAP2 family protein [Gemmatimonadales bacterium]|nr:phosphatase PAP2 family protein [Gemmatimonadales bacterium]